MILTTPTQTQKAVYRYYRNFIETNGHGLTNRQVAAALNLHEITVWKAIRVLAGWHFVTYEPRKLCTVRIDYRECVVCGDWITPDNAHYTVLHGEIVVSKVCHNCRS